MQSAKYRVSVFVALAILIGAAPFCRADELNELPLEGWKKLREVERYQMQVAEKYWREQNWKAALSEYEKFMTLYEKSEGAPFAHLIERTKQTAPMLRSPIWSQIGSGSGSIFMRLPIT